MSHGTMGSLGINTGKSGFTYSEYSSVDTQNNLSDVDSDFDANKEKEVTLAIDLIEYDDLWVAIDEMTGIASQGENQDTAIENLIEAKEAYRGKGRSLTDSELREIGIDPSNNVSSERITEPFKQDP